jgi:hypothetical protein
MDFGIHDVKKICSLSSAQYLKGPQTQLNRRLEDPTANFNILAKRKIPVLFGN